MLRDAARQRRVVVTGPIKTGRGPLIGDAGEHFVVAELLRRGWLAALAPRNSTAFDAPARHSRHSTCSCPGNQVGAPSPRSPVASLSVVRSAREKPRRVVAHNRPAECASRYRERQPRGVHQARRIVDCAR